MSAEALPDFTLLILVYNSNPEKIRLDMLDNCNITQDKDSELQSVY